MRRKFLAAREDLVIGVSNIARDKRMTIFGFVNEALEQTLRAEGFKRSLREVVDDYENMTIAKETGYLIVAEELLYPLLERYYGEDRAHIAQAWYNQGAWYGKILPVRFTDRDLMEAVEKFMRTILWGISDFTLSKSRNGLSVRCIGPRLSASYTSLLVAFLEGMLNTLGYATVSKDISRGIILLTFRVKDVQKGPSGSRPKETL